MKTIRVAALMLCSVLLTSCSEASAPRTQPVLVELFTSQGCSSCPPADSLLERLAASPEYRDRIIPLALHVDYWDRLGWTDPLGRADFADRQRAYAKRLSPTKLYTPELVVNGAGECIGDDESAARELIDGALAVESPGRVTLTRLPAKHDSLRVRVEAETHAAPGDTLDVLVAIYESGLVTAITEGENAGKTLSDAFAVRTLVPAFTLPAAAPRRGSAVLAVPLGPAWNPARLGAAAFIQDRKTLAITGAALSPAAD